MNKNFIEKYNNETLFEELKDIYMKLCILHANVCFLNNYCKLSMTKDGIDYFITITNDIIYSIENIDDDFQKILKTDISIKEKNIFIKDFIEEYYEPVIKI